MPELHRVYTIDIGKNYAIKHSKLKKEMKIMATIAAIATAPSNGGIGIIRMSGKKCFDIL